MVGLLGFGVLRGVRVYEAFVDGAKDGFQVAVRIIPYLVAILVAVGMFRASGAMESVDRTARFIDPFGRTAAGGTADGCCAAIGFGAYGILASILSDPATGPDTYVGYFEHISRFNGNDVLRACRLFRRGANPPNSACAGGWFDGRPGRYRCRGVYLRGFICLIRSTCTKNRPRSVETRPEFGEDERAEARPQNRIECLRN